MDIGDFQSERYSFELRFARAYIMWDRSGAMVKAIQREFPSAEVVEGNPSRVQLTVKPNIEIVFENDKSFVIVHRPKRGGEELTNCARVITQAVTEIFEVASFMRVGTRLSLARTFDSLEKATERLLAFGMLRTPTGRFFNQKDALKQCDYRYRWEGDTTGVALHFATHTQQIEFSPNAAHFDHVEAVSKTIHQIAIDIDYFSTATILVEQFRTDEWIKNVLHLVNRDTKLFMQER